MITMTSPEHPQLDQATVERIRSRYEGKVARIAQRRARNRRAILVAGLAVTALVLGFGTTLVMKHQGADTRVVAQSPESHVSVTSGAPPFTGARLTTLAEASSRCGPIFVLSGQPGVANDQAKVWVDHSCRHTVVDYEEVRVNEVVTSPSVWTPTSTTVPKLHVDSGRVWFSQSDSGVQTLRLAGPGVKVTLSGTMSRETLLGLAQHLSAYTSPAPTSSP